MVPGARAGLAAPSAPPLDTIRRAWYNPPRMDGTVTKKRDNVMRVRVSDEEREWLEEIAAMEDRSLSNVLRLALKEFYQRRMEES